MSMIKQATLALALLAGTTPAAFAQAGRVQAGGGQTGAAPGTVPRAAPAAPERAGHDEGTLGNTGTGADPRPGTGTSTGTSTGGIGLTGRGNPAPGNADTGTGRPAAPGQSPVWTR